MNPIVQVFRKEIQEILRDKRVRSAAILTPVIVVFLMISLFGVIASSVGGKTKQKVYAVQSSSPLMAQLKKNPRLDVQEVTTEAQGESLIRKGDARVVLSIGPENADHQTAVRLLFDPKEDFAEMIKQIVKAGFQPYSESVGNRILGDHGLTRQQIEPVTYVDVPVKVGEGNGAGGMIVSLLPYLMVLFTFTGGFSIAADMVAGEKDKSTLETLLISPVDRTQIVLGKFLAVLCVCGSSAISSVLALYLANVLHIPGSEAMFAGGFGLSGKAILATAICLLPLAAFFAGLLIAVSSYARNSREAQTYLGIVNLLVIIPAVFSQVLGFTDLGSKNWINFVPVLSTAANMRAAFQGKENWVGVAEAACVAAVLGVVMLRLAIHLFNREQVLARV
ncbi:MAG TPA: ABC transporter permease [Fimbriimonas sp.]|nr:ABC transporter permease [Fimbriimonas sp.]